MRICFFLVVCISERDDALRGGSKYLRVSNSPFVSPERLASEIDDSASMDGVLPSIGSFPPAESCIAQASNARRASGGPHFSQDDLTKGDSITGIEIMMRRLLQEQSDRVEEMHRHQRAEDRAEVKRTIETAIAQHVQPLNTVIAQERGHHEYKPSQKFNSRLKVCKLKFIRSAPTRFQIVLVKDEVTRWS